MSPWPHLGSLAYRFSPASQDYPKNWEDLPVDQSIPDIASWSPARMSQYLVQNGVKEIVAKVFFDQVCNFSLINYKKYIFIGMK